MLFIVSAWRFFENSALPVKVEQAWTIFIRVLTRHHFYTQHRSGWGGRHIRPWQIYTELSEIEYRDLEQTWTSQDRRRVLQEIISSLHMPFNLINWKIKINTNFIAKRLRGISQAAVISVSTDTRPTSRTGAIGEKVGWWELKRSISVLPMMSDRGVEVDADQWR